jgi:broad specificity phosphatase PhoE
MAAQRIILLRHAEKPSPDGRVQGVDANGQPNPNELSIRGWQRAGALARFFAPGGGNLGVPDALYAGAPTLDHPSRRSISTLEPLAQRLALPLDRSFSRNDEASLLETMSERDGLVLVAWDHRGLCRIANALMGSSEATPQSWPNQCFDRFWVFSRRDGGWDFESRAQRLLAGDS